MGCAGEGRGEGRGAPLRTSVVRMVRICTECVSLACVGCGVVQVARWVWIKGASLGVLGVVVG